MRKHPIEWLADLKHEQRSVGEMLQIAAIHKALGIAPLSLHGRMIISAWKIQDSNYNHEFLINNDSYMQFIIILVCYKLFLDLFLLL